MVEIVPSGSYACASERMMGLKKRDAKVAECALKVFLAVDPPKITADRKDGRGKVFNLVCKQASKEALI